MSFEKIRQMVASRFGLVLTLSFLPGLFLPGLERTPPGVVPYLLAGMIFFSAARIRMADMRAVRLVPTGLFYALRFLAWPFALYWFGLLVAPRLAPGLLLLGLLPAGATTPAMATILGGNPAMALVLLLVSSFAAPFVLPAMFGLTGHGGVSVDLIGLCRTQILFVGLPILIFFLLERAMPRVRAPIERNAAFCTVLLIVAIVAIVIAEQRALFFGDARLLALALALSTLSIASFYLFGWYFPSSDKDETRRLTYALSSGASNTALGISLGFLYFSKEVAFFMIVAEVPWVLLIAVFKVVAARSASRAMAVQTLPTPGL